MKIRYNEYSSEERAIVRNWIFRRVNDHVELAGLYSSNRNFWVHAKLEDGKIVYNNPRQVRIPQYALDVVADMLNQ